MQFIKVCGATIFCDYWTFFPAQQDFFLNAKKIRITQENEVGSGYPKQTFLFGPIHSKMCEFSDQTGKTSQ